MNTRIKNNSPLLNESSFHFRVITCDVKIISIKLSAFFILCNSSIGSAQGILFTNSFFWSRYTLVLTKQFLMEAQKKASLLYCLFPRTENQSSHSVLKSWYLQHQIVDSTKTLNKKSHQSQR